MTRRQVMLVFAGVMLAMLLAALDQTIVATALPRIAVDLHGLQHYSWVASAYAQRRRPRWMQACAFSARAACSASIPRGRGRPTDACIAARPASDAWPREESVMGQDSACAGGVRPAGRRPATVGKGRRQKDEG